MTTQCAILWQIYKFPRKPTSPFIPIFSHCLSNVLMTYPIFHCLSNSLITYLLPVLSNVPLPIQFSYYLLITYPIQFTHYLSIPRNLSNILITFPISPEFARFPHSTVPTLPSSRQSRHTSFCKLLMCNALQETLCLLCLPSVRVDIPPFVSCWCTILYKKYLCPPCLPGVRVGTLPFESHWCVIFLHGSLYLLCRHPVRVDTLPFVSCWCAMLYKEYLCLPCLPSVRVGTLPFESHWCAVFYKSYLRCKIVANVRYCRHQSPPTNFDRT